MRMEEHRNYRRQKNGESTSSGSSSDDNNSAGCYNNNNNSGNGEDKRENERIIWTMVNSMALLADMSGSMDSGRRHNEFVDERDTRSRRSPSRISARNQSRRKRRLPPPLSPTLNTNMNIGGRTTITTPEREVPRSSQETYISETIPPPLPTITTEDDTRIPIDLDIDSSAPGLISISPDTDFSFNNDTTYPLHRYQQQEPQTAANNHETNECQEERFYRSRSWAKQKLAAVIFSHPGSLRSFCIEAYHAAREQSLLTMNNHDTDINTDNYNYDYTDTNETREAQLFNNDYDDDNILDGRQMRTTGIPRSCPCNNNVFLSITSDTFHVCLDLTLDVSFSTLRVTVMALHSSFCVVVNVWDGVTRSAYTIITRPFNVMGKTREVVVSGIQSVATGVGSASSIALHRLSERIVRRLCRVVWRMAVLPSTKGTTTTICAGFVPRPKKPW